MSPEANRGKRPEPRVELQANGAQPATCQVYIGDEMVFSGVALSALAVRESEPHHPKPTKAPGDRATHHPSCPARGGGPCVGCAVRRSLPVQSFRLLRDRLLGRATATDEIDRNARAYGWEVGRGHALVEVLVATPDNPFLDPDWRDVFREGKS